MESHQKDFFTEILNIGMGKAAGVLERLTQFPVNLTVPTIKVTQYENLSKQLVEFGQDDLVSVKMTFKGIVSGDAVFLLSPFSALILTELVMKTAHLEELRSAEEEVVTEVGNIVLNNVIGSWSRLFCDRFEFGVPTYRKQPLKELLGTWINSPATSTDLQTVRADTHFEIENLFILGSVLVMFDSESLARFITSEVAE